jgi:hypothetical protein
MWLLSKDEPDDHVMDVYFGGLNSKVKRRSWITNKVFVPFLITSGEEATVLEFLL